MIIVASLAHCVAMATGDQSHLSNADRNSLNLWLMQNAIPENAQFTVSGNTVEIFSNIDHNLTKCKFVKISF